MFLGAVIGVAYVVLHRPDGGPSVGLGLGVSVALVCAFGVNVAQWLWEPPGIMKELALCKELNLRWFAPHSTPGIRLLAEGFGLSTLLLLAGAGFILVPTFTDVPLLSEIAPFSVGVLLLVSLRIGAMTLFKLYILIRREKHRVMDELNDRIPELADILASDVDATADLSEVYERVEGSALLPFGTSTLIQYAVAFLGIAGGLVTAQLTQ
jgi:hypothetical protein